MGISEIFKPYLKEKRDYEGGKNIPPQAGKVYKLSSNENPIGASSKAIKAIREAAHGISFYPDQTDLRLRNALAKHYDHRLNNNQFITQNSGSEIIDLALRLFVNLGDEIIYSTPCFSPYFVFASWYGAVGKNVPLQFPNYELDVEGILNAITPKTKIIFLTSPNNPTGTYLPKGVLENLLERLPKNILVIYDEVYRHFATAEDFVTAEPFVQRGCPVLAINSFSKTYGLAGLRVGYAYTTEEIANYLRSVQKPFTLSTPAIEGSIAALEDEDFLSISVKTVIKGRHYLETNYTQIGIEYWPSQANFHLITPPLPELEFTDQMMKKGIMVRPVTPFGAAGKVRITVGNQEANEALINALKGL